MKNLNNGKTIYDFNKINDYGLENAAHDFAEGSPELERLLKLLWSLNIKTYACCKGEKTRNHKTAWIKQPYVSILIEDETKDLIFKIAEKIIASKNISKPDVIFVSDNIEMKGRQTLLLQRLAFHNRACKDMFAYITETIKDVVKQNNKNKIEDNLTNQMFEMCKDVTEKELDDYYLYFRFMFKRGNYMQYVLSVDEDDKKIVNLNSKNKKLLKDDIEECFVSSKTLN